MTQNQRRSEAYREQNERSARIVAADTVMYPPGSLMHEWAAMILERAGTAVERDPGPLFRTSNLSESHIDEVKGRNHD